jgi:arginine N-succinyltransferase
MPKYPIVTNLLPEDAQFVVGKVHPNTEPAKRILEQEGFKFSGLVGIFEPGPVLIADVDNIRAIKESTIAEIEEISEKNFKSEIYIVSRTSGTFRSALGGVVKLKSGNLKISGVTAAALKLRLGDKIRYVSFKPKSAPVKKKVAPKKK